MKTCSCAADVMFANTRMILRYQKATLWSPEIDRTSTHRREQKESRRYIDASLKSEAKGRMTL